MRVRFIVLGLCAFASSAQAAPAGSAAPTGSATAPAPAAAATKPAAGTVNLRAVGDIVFGRHHDGVLLRFKNDLFSATAPLLSAADLAFANIETPIVDGPDVLPGGGRGGPVRRGLGWMRFRADPARARALAAAGFDIVSTANNHAYDFGADSIPVTRRHLEEAGVTTLGSGSEPATPRILERHGVKVGFLGATLVSNRPADPAELSYVEPGKAAEVLGARVRELRPRVDVVVVSLHWGVEYNQSANAGQIALAHALVDAGADLILGHHPHVVQGLERYKGAVIAYSLGNFVFDMADPVKRESMILDVSFTASGAGGRPTVAARALPMLIDRDHVPAPPPPARAAAMRAAWAKLARRFGTTGAEGEAYALVIP